MIELVLNTTYKYVPTEIRQHHLTMSCNKRPCDTFKRTLNITTHEGFSLWSPILVKIYYTTTHTRTLSVSKTDENVIFMGRIKMLINWKISCLWFKLLKPGTYTLNHAEKAYHALIIGVGRVWVSAWDFLYRRKAN